MKTLLSFAQLVRLPNTFTTWADIILGALTTGFLANRRSWLWSRLTTSDSANLTTVWQELQSWCVLLCLLASSTLLYWSGMIWNDYFDVVEDARDRPGRPLPSGRISMRTASWFALGFMVIGVLFAVLADLLNAREIDGAFVIRWRAGPIAGVLVLAIFLYDGVLKETFAGPMLMGLCRALNILLGLSILGAFPPFWGWLLALIIGIYIGGVTWFAQTEVKTSSQPILIAAAIVILISLLLTLTVPALALESPGNFSPSAFFPFLLAAFGGYLGMAILRAIRRPDPLRVQTAVKRAILGLVVLDTLLASAFVGSLGLLLAILLIPGMILGRWLYST